jgi:hypothetical protein
MIAERSRAGEASVCGDYEMKDLSGALAATSDADLTLFAGLTFPEVPKTPVVVRPLVPPVSTAPSAPTALVSSQPTSSTHLQQDISQTEESETTSLLHSGREEESRSTAPTRTTKNFSTLYTPVEASIYLFYFISWMQSCE